MMLQPRSRLEKCLAGFLLSAAMVIAPTESGFASQPLEYTRDSFKVGQQTCKFFQLTTGRCCEIVDTLPVDVLNELLGKIVAFIASRTAPAGKLALYRHYHASLFSSELLLQSGWGVAFDASTNVANSVGQNARTGAEENAKASAWYGAWGAVVSAATKAGHNVARDAASIQVASSGIIGAAKKVVELGAWQAGKEGSRQGLPAREIGHQMYLAAEHSSLAFFAKNSCQLWKVAYQASIDELEKSITELPYENLFSAWSAGTRSNSFFKAYLRTFDHIEKRFWEDNG